MKEYSEEEEKKVEETAARYRDFLDRGKTERECAKNVAGIAKAHGYRNLDEIIAEGESLKAGDKIYAVNMKKAVILMSIGSEPLEKGMRLIGAHIDSPRIDIKQNPLYEDSGLAYLDTHYYGGIKKYQWVTSPMALHGTIVKKDGTSVDLSVGEDPADPVIGVTDILIHLAAQQMEKKAGAVINGEAMDVLVGSRPAAEKEDGDQKKDENPVKTHILHLLKEKYDIEEKDFSSAELEVVPAGRARDFGLDASMIMAYGQDDRVCAFCQMEAILAARDTEKTHLALFVDKEEIGSVGATGMHSHFLENTVAEVLNCLGQYSDLALRRTLRNSRMLSADVSAGYDPLYPESFEKKNSAFLGRGASINKFTGSRGKGGSNDANAEYLGWLRCVFDAADIVYQTAELGRVDVGGGGTIAYINASYGMDVVDLGVPVLNMHAPYEISSKYDVYETIRCYQAFYEA